MWLHSLTVTPIISLLQIPFLQRLESAIHAVNNGAANEVDAAELSGPPPAVVSQIRDLQALCHGKLGVNYVQTEENQSGEGHLVHALGWLVQRFGIKRARVAWRSIGVAEASALSGLSGKLVAGEAASEAKTEDSVPPSPIGALALPDFVALACGALEICNYLALLYSGWDNHARALRCLRTAKAIYRRVKQLQAAALKAQAQASSAAAASNDEDSTSASTTPAAVGTSDTALEAPLLSDPSATALLSWAQSAGMANLHSMYTHTLFYYAQVYGHLQVPDTAAAYVEQTLSRQLAEQAAADQLSTVAAAAGVSSSGSGTDASAAGAIVKDPTAPDWQGGASSASLDKIEWTRNTLRIAEYHAGRRHWKVAAVCCYAAEGMLGQVVKSIADARAAAAGGEAGQPAQAAASTSSAATTTKPIGPIVDWKTLPESVSRLLAETATHWGLIFEGMLKAARDRDLAVQNGLPEDAIERDDADDDDEDDDDPFNTGASIKFNRKTGGRSAGNTIRGDGEDVIDADDSDHEGDLSLLQCAGDSAPSLMGTSQSKRSSESTLLSGPFADFVTKSRQYKDYITSYGPSRISATDASTLCSPARTYASGLTSLIEPAQIRDFDTARAVFKAANAAFARGKEFFVLDGFVSEHIGILQGISRIYKYLAFYEPDQKRAAAMHIRRVDALSPLIKELNSNVFMRYHREASLESAAAMQDVFDLRLVKLEEKLQADSNPRAVPLPADLQACNEAVDAAIGYYAHFIRCFDDPRVKDVPVDGRNRVLKPLPGATGVEAGSAEAYLTAHFCTARLLTRRMAPAAGERVEDCKCALQRFQWLVKSAPLLAPPGSMVAPAPKPAAGAAAGGGAESAASHGSPSTGFFASELAMCREMVELLPSKINHMHHRGVDVQAPGSGMMMRRG